MLYFISSLSFENMQLWIIFFRPRSTYVTVFGSRRDKRAEDDLHARVRVKLLLAAEESIHEKNVNKCAQQDDEVVSYQMGGLLRED